MKKKLKTLSSLSKMDNFTPLTKQQLSSVTGGYMKHSDQPIYQSSVVLNPGQVTEVCIKSC